VAEDTKRTFTNKYIGKKKIKNLAMMESIHFDKWLKEYRNSGLYYEDTY